jgi:hypothetical protein
MAALETGGTMTGDSTKIPDKADGQDEIRKQSMAELSRRLGERLARQTATDPAAAAAARRAALQEYERTRERRLIAVLGVAVAAIIGAGTVYFVSTGDSSIPPSASIAVRPEPAAPLAVAAATPTPTPPQSTPPSTSSPTPAASVPDTPPAEPAVMQAAAPAMDSQPAPVEPAPSLVPLRPDEVKEVQTRLRSFGFNPGPADGTAGRMTEAAALRYQQDRGQQTAGIDRQLLEQLRQDPAPQVAQRAARPGPRATSASARRSDPFEPVRAAGDRLGRWMDSLVR